MSGKHTPGHTRPPATRSRGCFIATYLACINGCVKIASTQPWWYGGECRVGSAHWSLVGRWSAPVCSLTPPAEAIGDTSVGLGVLSLATSSPWHLLRLQLLPNATDQERMMPQLTSRVSLASGNQWIDRPMAPRPSIVSRTIPRAVQLSSPPIFRNGVICLPPEYKSGQTGPVRDSRESRSLGTGVLLTKNEREAELSYAYVHAIAARAGFGCESSGRQSDRAGIDARLHVKERLDELATHTDFPIEIQLKATSQQPVCTRDHYSHWLKSDHFEKLRNPGIATLRLLVVLFLPEDESEWLLHDETNLITKRCAYWVCLKGAAPSDNATGQTVYIPKANSFSHEGLRAIARRYACLEAITYVLP